MTTLIQGKPKGPEPPAPDDVIRAVVESLDDIYDDSWGGIKVYVQKAPCVPAKLDAVGSCPAEVIDELDLRAKYEFHNTSPALARVHAWKDAHNHIHVVVAYAPLDMKDHRPMIVETRFAYEYLSAKGRFVKLGRTHPQK